MKHNFFLKLVFTVLLSGYFSVSYGATPIYLATAANGGSDSNNGLTVGAPVATLSQAMTLVDASGTIIVSGNVSATSETTLAKNVTIQGTSNTSDGFTGNNSARFMSNGTYNLTLSNLKFTSYAVTAGNGGVLLLSGGTVSITNVNFDTNKALTGGAISVTAGTVTLNGCTIQNNDNTSIASSLGGAIYVKPAATVSLDVKNTLIKNNKTTVEGGAIYYVDNAVTACTMKFTNCAVISNTTGGTTTGAGSYINNATASATVGITFINTTFYDNTAGGTSGGAMFVNNLRTGSVIDFRNCTITGNKVLCNTLTGISIKADAGAGIRCATAVNTNLGVVKIYNTIMENNYCPGALTSATAYSTDFVWQGDSYVIGTTLIIQNSLICRPLTASGSRYTNANFPTCNLNYFSASSGDVRNSYIAKFGTFNSTYNALPLLSNSSALGTGLKSYLTDLNPTITTDQVGNSRTQATACDAGAIEVPRVSITSTSTPTTSDSPIPVTITFSNAVTGFDASDITVTNGTKGTLSGSGTTYTMNITPTAAGAVTVDIAANAANDVVVNGNVAAAQFTRTYALAGSPPSVAISSSTLSTTQTNPIPVTITFSEAVTGFDASDISVGNGTKSNFVAVSGTIYTVDITPTTQGNITVDVAANAAINATSNGNTVATQFVRTYYKDIYLSSTGNDSNNGFTSGTAVATLSAALTKAIAGEKIYVSGMISFSSDVTLSKTITILGTSNATDGFNGNNSTRFIQANSGSYTLTLKNMELINGSTTTTGGALYVNGSTVNCDNVIFDNNKAETASQTGGAIHVAGTNGMSFKNCVFSNNSASKSGAIYINDWVASSSIKFEGCAFISNKAKDSFGGSALFIRSASDNNSLSLINCTFAKNEVRTSTNGGAVYLYKGGVNTLVNIVNCTITENSTAGGLSTSAGVYMLNSTGNYLGKLYISNSIIESNIAAGGIYSDFNTSSTAPTSTTLQINNSIIGRHGASAVIPTGCFGSQNQFNYLTATSTPGDFVAGLAAFNSTNNFYPLYIGSTAINYGASTYLTSLSPTVTTDQLGNVRTVVATNYAGAWESTPIATTTPAAPTALVATAGDGQASVAFTTAATGGSAITNYKYSIDGTNFVACSPAKTTSPIVVTGLTNTNAYNIKLKAVNTNGDGAESAASNSITPDASTNDFVISTPINVSTLALTPVSDLVVTSNTLTINQPTAVNSITVAAGAKITVSGTNALTATNGITLQSSETATATLVDNYTDPTITATVEQYLPQGRNWYVSSPIETNIATAGSLKTAGATSVSYYSEELGWQNDYLGNLAEGVGYIAVSSDGINTNKISFNGKLNSGDVPIMLTRKSSGSFAGFNLIANPYPSYVNPMPAINANANLVGTIWYRTRKTVSPYEYKFETVNTTSGVGTNAAGTGTVTGFIPPMQAFWVRTNVDNQPFTFTNSMRDHAHDVTVLGQPVPTTPLKARKLETQSLARIKVTGNAGSDEAVLYFNGDASNAYDNYDSPKMFESATVVSPEIYTTAGNEKLVINGLNFVPYDVEIPLGFIAKQAGDYSFSRSEMTNFETGTRIMLKDKLQPSVEIELGESTNYNFSSQTTVGNDRFSLTFRAPGVATDVEKSTIANVQVFVNAVNQITIIAPENATYSIYNAVGQKQFESILTSPKATVNKSFSAGVYFVELRVNAQTQIQKVVIR